MVTVLVAPEEIAIEEALPMVKAVVCSKTLPLVDSEALSAKLVAALVPEPRMEMALPAINPAMVMTPFVLVFVRVRLLNVEELSDTAAAESVIETVPPILPVKLAAAVETFKLVGVPVRLKEVELPVLLTVVNPVVLAVRLVTLEVTLKVAAEPANDSEPVLAALLM
jgi:hypothetical protein